MLLIRDIGSLPGEALGGAVTVGNFDGVHLGHAQLVERVVQCARSLQRSAVVVTFDPHPLRLLRPQDAPPLLTWLERKAALLGALGVDMVVAYPTNRQLLSLEPEEFFEQILHRLLQARAVIEGPNFFFGRHRRGDVHLLSRLCQQAGIALYIVEPTLFDNQPISSSRIRQLISCGDVAMAARLLTEPYRIRGQVVRGAQRGARLGFPTANLAGVDTLLPATGVYAGRAYLGDRTYPAAIHIGANPTFGELATKVEIHLIGFHGNLEGTWLEVDFLARLRETQMFRTVEELQAQLAADVAAAAQLAAQYRDDHER